MSGSADIVGLYADWLRRELSLSKVADTKWSELTTPFMDRHNDHLQLYVARDGDRFTLTDDGYILADLKASGFELNSPRRRTTLDTVLAGLGVKNEDGQLTVQATEHSIGQRIHSLVQAMLAVNDLHVLAKSHVASYFWEDVKQFLEDSEVRFIPKVKVTGKSGYDQAVDFVIPKSKERPERLLQAINDPTRGTIAGFLFVLTDTRDARGANTEAFAVLNDNRAVASEVIEALENYAVKPIMWSQRAEAIRNLAA